MNSIRNGHAGTLESVYRIKRKSDGAERNVEALGDFFAGAAVEVAEQHDFAATSRKGAQRLGEGFAALAALHRFDDGGRSVEEGEFDEPLIVGEGFVGMDVAAAEEIDGGVARGREEKGFRVGEPAGVVDAQDAHIGLLHEVIVVGQAGEPSREERAQRRLVRLHAFGKPNGLISGWHGVSRGLDATAVWIADHSASVEWNSSGVGLAKTFFRSG